MMNSPQKKILRFLPIIILGALTVAAYVSGILDQMNFSYLRENANDLRQYVNENHVMSALMYMGIYVAVAALSLPVGSYLSITGGFLFPQPFSTIYTVVGATLGASLLFCAAKTALGDYLKKKTAPFITSFSEGFKENAANYMLFLRLVPLFPFWLVNLVPAFLGVPLTTFFWTTMVGIIPGSFVFTQIGDGLMGIFETDETFSMDCIFNRDLMIGMTALGIWVLIPVIYKRWKKTH